MEKEMSKDGAGGYGGYSNTNQTKMQQAINQLEQRIDELEKQNEMMKEVLEFYANKSHWGVAGVGENVSIDPSDYYDPWETEYTTSNDVRGGKKALELLNKLYNKE